MKLHYWAAAALGAVLLSGCETTDKYYDAPPPPPPPPANYGPPIGPGAIAGTVAADRNGDGVVDGYYTADGRYHAIDRGNCPPPPPPPPRPTPRGERG